MLHVHVCVCVCVCVESKHAYALGKSYRTRLRLDDCVQTAEDPILEAAGPRQRECHTTERACQTTPTNLGKS